jgi:hypothetical protein
VHIIITQHPTPNTRIYLRVRILVEAEEAGVATKAAEYLARVAATTEGNVNINAAGADVKPLYALPEEYRNVVCLCCLGHDAVVR